MVLAHTDSKAEFSKLIEPLFDEIYAYALRMTRNKQHAEDLASDTFARAWKYFGHYKPNTNFRAWLYSILTSIYINQYRKNKKNPVKIDYDRYGKTDEFYVYNKISNQAGSQPDNPEKLIADKFSGEDVRSAVEKLSDDFRQVFLLSDIKGFSYREIASILKVPLGTVRSRLNRARKFLQKELWYHKRS